MEEPTRVPTQKEREIAYKRPDGKWSLCVSTREPMIATHNDLMDITKYFITNVGSTKTEADVKRQSRRMKRERMKEEVKHQRSAKIIAEKRRVEWLREKYLDFVRSVREGNPWSFEKYQKHATEIETPITYTVGNYKVVTGGINKSTCFKTLAGEIISDAISGRSKNFSEQMNDRDTSLTAATKKKKISDSRTENTYFGSDALSAERRLTKRTKQDQAEEKERKMKTLTKNIQAGKEVV